jgi:ubiquinone/menaquinone biosynthesis C-methylase UbiE
MLSSDSDYFQELQTQTGWSRTLYGFALWCSPKAGWLTLDIGCGPGLLPAIFSKFGCRAMGVDLNLEMFHPSPLHSFVAVANVYDLPFNPQSFDLITASNLIFLLSEPSRALNEMNRMLRPGGKAAMLNPSEYLNEQAAIAFAHEKGLDGVARDTLLIWARRAEENHHWTDEETCDLYRKTGMKYMGSVLKVGPGFGRFSWGIT